MAVAVEICLSGGPAVLASNCVAAREGGATRVELCAAMRHQGLSPSSWQIATAAEALDGRVELVTMLRPRPGSFDLSSSDVRQLCRRMERAAALGATGVALGALKGKALDRDAMLALTEQAHGLGLKITCHRAFDALSRPFQALDFLLELGVQRVLSAGQSWGQSGGAARGLPRLVKLANHLDGRMELVVAGGVNAALAPMLCANLAPTPTEFSLHAWSAAHAARRVHMQLVRNLVLSASSSPHGIQFHPLP
jgi:copper homeostasis protein